MGSFEKARDVNATVRVDLITGLKLLDLAYYSKLLIPDSDFVNG